EAILATHGAPSIDAFTFSMAGRTWLDQQWGAQVLLALVFRAGGWAAMGFFHAALVGATFWFLWLACRARGASARLSATLTLVGPYGVGVWRYAIGISTNERILGHIEEWSATTIRSADGALFFVSALAIVVLLARRGTKTDWLTLAWLGSFFLIGLSAARGEV